MYHSVSNSTICAIKAKEKCRLEKIRAAKERKQKKKRDADYAETKQGKAHGAEYVRSACDDEQTCKSENVCIGFAWR